MCVEKNGLCACLYGVWCVHGCIRNLGAGVVNVCEEWVLCMKGVGCVRVFKELVCVWKEWGVYVFLRSWVCVWKERCVYQF